MLQVKPCDKDGDKTEGDLLEAAIDWKEKQGKDDDMTVIFKVLEEKQSTPK